MRLFIVFLFSLGAILAPQDAQSQQSSELQKQLNVIEATLGELHDDLVDFRRDLHKNPEVSGQERRTARKVSKRLEALGYDVRKNIGGHGVVAVMKGGQPGPVVAFRADMDAVYSDAPDPVQFASLVPGVRHICGHDIHTTIGVALAEGFARIQPDLKGSVVLIFQPAEERVQGARAMIDEGALQNPRPDAIFAVHTAPFETGQIGSKPGIMMARRGNLVIKLEGGEDLTSAAKSVENAIGELNTLPPGTMSAEDDFVLTNVFRSESSNRGRQWVIRAGVTTTFSSLENQIKEDIQHVLQRLDEKGIKYQVDYSNSSAAGVTNDLTLEQQSRIPIRAVLGDASHIELTTVPTLFSEDFGLFQEEVPGVMYFLGVSNAEKGWVGMPHSPDYVADEEAIFAGAKAMAAVMLDVMADGE